MKGLSEGEVNALIEKKLERKFGRLIANRFFDGTIRTVTQQTGPSWLCRLARTGEAAADGNAYLATTFRPVVGQVVICAWLDANVGMILFPKTVAVGGTSMVIDDQVVGAAAVASIRIPAVGVLPKALRHLRVTWQLRCDNAADQNLVATYNGDASALYAWERITYTNVTLTGAPGAAAAFHFLGVVPGTGIQAGAFSHGELTLPNYDSVAFFKSFRAQSWRRTGAGAPAAADMFAYIVEGEYQSLNPITFITISAAAGNLITGGVVTTEAVA